MQLQNSRYEKKVVVKTMVSKKGGNQLENLR